MIGHVTIEPKAAEPAVCQVEVNLFAQAPLLTNAGAIPDQQHPDHQFRINRRSSDITVEWRQVLPDLLKVDKPVN